MARTVERPWQIYALTALWAIKGAEEFLRGVVGTGFYIAAQMDQGRLSGYGLQLAIQSVLFSLALTVGSVYVMTALWLGKRSARRWGVILAALGELSILAYLITRPPEFGGDVPLIRTVLTASIVNAGIAGLLLFDARLAAFLGSTRLTGWWAPKR
jgi:hypothetical protein